jgi:hypothetical protein
MRIDVAAGIWLLELLVAGRLADFHVPRWQSAVLRALTLVRIDYLLPVYPSLADALPPEPAGDSNCHVS